ncbi:MAG: hypothetical protein ABSC39_20080 [Roseiarcus sp.]
MFINDRCARLRVRAQQCALQRLRRVVGGAESDDGQAKHCAHNAAQTSGDLPPAAPLNPFQEVKDLSGGDLGDRTVLERLSQVLKKPFVFRECHWRCAVGLLVRKEFGDDEAERVARGSLRCDPVEFLLNRRANPFGQTLSGVVTFATGVGKRDRRKWTNGQHLLDACEPIAEAPELVSVRLDEEIEAVAVGELGLSRASAALASKKVRTMLVPVCGEGGLTRNVTRKKGRCNVPLCEAICTPSDAN